MADFTEQGTVSITCPLGMTSYLERELKDFGHTPTKKRQTGLEIKASLNDCIELNFWLRSAHRIHFLVGEKRVNNADELYDWLEQLPWEDWISPHGYVSVTSRIDHPAIDNTQYANLRVKDAVVDRIRDKTGTRPDSGSDLDQTVLFLYWNRHIARIFVDTSGESLSRRGYRAESVGAPMQETLASAIIMESEWEPGQHFVNPMCGSGTLVIEAALMAQNRPPASLRHDFGFMHLKGYREEIYQNIRETAKQQTIKKPEGTFIATDHSADAVKAAEKNAMTAGVDQLIDFDVCPFEKTPVPNGDGVIVFNPPYGERLGEIKELEKLYRQMGDFLKQECPGKFGYIFTGSLDLAKKVGLRTNRREILYNSTIECRLLEYEMYKGSR